MSRADGAALAREAPARDGVQALRATAAMAARSVVLDGLGLVAAIILARGLSVADFGVYGALLSVLIVVEAWMPTGVVTFFTRQRDRIVTRDTVRLAIVVNLAIAAVVVACAAPFLSRGGVWLGIAIGCAVALLPLRLLPLVRLWREVGFGRLAVVQAAEGVVLQGTAIAAVLLGMGLGGIAVGVGAAAIVGLVLLRLVTRTTLRRAPCGTRPRWREWRGDILQWVSETAAQFAWVPAVWVISGAEAAGVVRWALVVAAPVMALLLLCISPLYAVIARMSPAAVRAHAARAFRAGLGVPLAYGLSMIVCLPVLTAPVFGDQWGAFVLPGQIFLAAMVIAAAGVLLRVLMQAAGHGAGNWRARSVSALVGIGLLWPAWQIAGESGTMLAILGAQAIWLAWLVMSAPAQWRPWVQRHVQVLALAVTWVLTTSVVAGVVLPGMYAVAVSAGVSALAVGGLVGWGWATLRGDIESIAATVRAAR